MTIIKAIEKLKSMNMEDVEFDDMGISFMDGGLYYRVTSDVLPFCETIQEMKIGADEVISGCCGASVDEDRMLCMKCKDHY